MFLEEECDLCGDCLVRCPELSLSEQEARTEIQKLIRGKEPQTLLTRCSSCFSCNFYCPRGCNPYDLILSRWNERYQRVGSPPVWKFIFPSEKSNLWSAMHAILPEKATGILEEWMTAPPAETIFLPGSYFHLVPEILAGSQLLRDVATLDLPGHWECGAYLYQGGYLGVVKQIGQMVRENLNKWGVKRVITALDAVHVMFTKVHPEETGVRFDQEIVNFHEWILRNIEDGQLSMERKLGITVTVHDNCYAKAGGTRYFDQARKLIDLAGVRVKEMRHHHVDALCCGFGRGAGWRSNIRIPFDILSGAAKRIREAEETGTDTLVTYCAGCFWLLLAARELTDSPIRVVHLIELVRDAMGEKVDFPRSERGWDILAAMTYQIMSTMGQQHLWIQNVKAELDPQEWRGRPQLFLKTFRKSLNTRAGQHIFRSSFNGLKRALS